MADFQGRLHEKLHCILNGVQISTERLARVVGKQRSSSSFSKKNKIKIKCQSGMAEEVVHCLVFVWLSLLVLHGDVLHTAHHTARLSLTPQQSPAPSKHQVQPGSLVRPSSVTPVAHLGP